MEDNQRSKDLQWVSDRLGTTGMSQTRDIIERQTVMEDNYNEKAGQADPPSCDPGHATTGSGDQDQEYSELLYRLYMRERDPELRQLMNRLQAAYIFKDQRQHILNSEYSRLQEKAEENSANRVQNSFQFNKELETLRNAQEKADRSTEYCHQLQQQLADKQQLKQCQYNDLLIEKNVIDNMLEAISDDDTRKHNLKQVLTERIRSEMLSFQQARSDLKLHQKEMNIAEAEKIESQVQQMADRAFGFEAVKEYKMQLKDDLNDIAVAKLEAGEAKREAMRELQQEQCHQNESDHDSSEKERKDDVRNEQFKEMNKMLKNRARLVEEHQQTNRDDRARMDTACSAADERYRSREAADKVVNMQYGDDLRHQIEDNRLRKLKDKKDERDRDARDCGGVNQGWFHGSGREKVVDSVSETADEDKDDDDDEEEEQLVDVEPGQVYQGAGVGRPDSISDRTHYFSEDNAEWNTQCKGLRKY